LALCQRGADFNVYSVVIVTPALSLERPHCAVRPKTLSSPLTTYQCPAGATPVTDKYKIIIKIYLV